MISDRPSTLQSCFAQRPPHCGLLCDELLLTVLGFVDGATLCRAGACCRQWRLQCEQSSLWRAIPLDLSEVRSLQRWRSARACSERSPHWRHAISLKVPGVACRTVMHEVLMLFGSRLTEVDLSGLLGDAALRYIASLWVSTWRPRIILDASGSYSSDDLRNDRKFFAAWLMRRCWPRAD